MCANGALAPERQVPGAYENPCMMLPVRDVPIVVASFSSSSTRDNVVVLKIAQAVPAAGSTGLGVWNSSLLLARLLQGLGPSYWKNAQQEMTTVVELGCGTAVASLAAAVLGATRVVATDGNPSVVQLAAANVQANQEKMLRSAVVETAVLPWGMLNAMDYCEEANLVIGSDLTYNPAGWPVLAESMATLLRPAGGLVLYVSLGHAGFNVQGEMDGFLSVAQSRGLVPVPFSDPDYPFAMPPLQYLQQTCRSVEERAVLENGLSVAVLRCAR